MTDGRAIQGGAWRWLLAGLLAMVAASSTLCILLDQAPTFDDPISNLLSAVFLRQAVEVGTREAWLFWLGISGERPPLPAVLYLLPLLLLDNAVHAVRLTDLVLLLCTIFLIYRIGSSLSSPAAGFLAALLFTAFPLTLGWSRVGNADPIIWFTLLLLFKVLIDMDLRSPWGALALGIAAGLCMLTRLLTLAFLVGPMVWAVAVTLRRPRHLAPLLAALTHAIVAAGWWYLVSYYYVVDNFRMSSGQDPTSGWRDLSMYLEYGYGWVFALTIAAGVVVHVRGFLPRRLLWLFVAWTVIPVLEFCLLWDSWNRYLLPLLPQCALLVAVAVDGGTVHLAPRWRRAALALVMAAALLPLVAYYARAEALLSGLMRPDQREHHGLARVLEHVPGGEVVLVVNEVGMAMAPVAWHRSQGGRVLPMRTPPCTDKFLSIQAHEAAGYLLLVTLPDMTNKKISHHCHPDPWWKENEGSLPLQLVKESHDPNGVQYILYRLTGPLPLQDCPGGPAAASLTQ